jgi:aminoglycoside phosphotransferase (APT) family kinase protein
MLAVPPVNPASHLNLQRLRDFLVQALPSLQGPLRAELIGGGQSNPTYFLDFDNRQLVLRKKPPGDILPSAHAIDREYRVMRALAGTGLPVPPTVLYHASDDVLGTPFYVMERLEGRVFNDASLPGLLPVERRAIYLAMAETLAQLHKVDWRAAGLTDFGRVGGYFQRQVRRWQQQWVLSKTRDIPEMDELIAWVAAHLPADDETTLTHGDFKLNNLMLHAREPRVLAVLDWELSTLGHPLADVAFSTVCWRSLPSEYGGIRGLDLNALGIPAEAEYLAHYLHHAGRRPDQGPKPFHWAFAFMRWAVIFEGIAARALRGNAASGNAAEVGRLSEALARRGLESARGG